MTAEDASKLCLSCHDGTIALGETISSGMLEFVQGRGYTLPPESAANLAAGQGFSDDHPYAFVPVPGPEIQMPPPGDAVRLDARGRLQCTSCHEPHEEWRDPAVGKFLVKPNPASALCLSCHRTAGWLHSSHRTPPDPVANLRAIAGVIEGLPAEVELVVFPEYALTGPPVDREQARRWALADCSGPVAELAGLAARRETHIVIGLLERVGDEIYSTAVLVGPEGELARYRKSHPIGPERDWCAAGRSRPPVVDLPLGRVGLLLGSDLCFPEIARALALAGCDLLAVPAGPGLPPVRGLGPTAVPLEPPAVTGEDPVHFHLARVRAIENGCYLAFASLPAPAGIGHSAVFGPTPAFRANEKMLGAGERGVVVREMDTTNLESEYPTCSVRAKDYLKMRQPHLYDLLQVAEPPAL
uniref:CN hydrolase domain-containing protein n=1 Tax=Thermorudis peleae TaxID=1382356 RepID=A0A831TF00_9BACT